MANKKFVVNVNITINSEYVVSARNKKEAIKKAKEKHAKRDHNNYTHGLDMPCIDIDFAEECDVEVYQEEESDIEWSMKSKGGI